MVIGIIVIIVLGLVVFGLRRGTLKSASVRGMGVTAGVEGHEESKPLKGQTMQTDGLRTKKSSIRMVKSARTSFKRTRLDESLIEILPDDGSPLRRPTDPPPPARPAGEDGR
ncbi:hypothetical protein ACIRPU_41550 [Streptomyces sp. NPDC102259]|uniref:hypothetical protein n=1 Tax=Streptomyces sp. NPDC102259 TaxID=3366148 RepID=UPI0037F6D5A7